MRSSTFVIAGALAAAIVAETTALTGGKKGEKKGKKGSDAEAQAKTIDGQGKAVYKIISDDVATTFVPTRSGCFCSNSYGVGEGDCDDGDVIYSGCMPSPCDGDSATDDDGTVWPSWCHTEEAECAGNNGANWDYCDPATAAVTPDQGDDGDTNTDRNPDDTPVDTNTKSKKKKSKAKKSKKPKDDGDVSRNPDGDESCPDGLVWHVSKSGKGKCKKTKAPKVATGTLSLNAGRETGAATTTTHQASSAGTIAVIGIAVFAVVGVVLVRRQRRASSGYDVINPATTVTTA